MLVYYHGKGSDMVTSKRLQEKKALFLCTHNSARFQMAEGLLRAMYGDRYEAYSAGVQATTLILLLL